MSSHDDAFAQDDNLRDDALLAKLRAMNPVPDVELTELEQARSERALASIFAADAEADAVADSAAKPPAEATVTTARPRRWFQRPAYLTGAAAAAAVLVAGMITVPGLVNKGAPTASAREILTQSAQAAEHQPTPDDLSMTSADYVRRVDSVGDAAVTRAFQTNGGGLTTVAVDKQGNLPPELAALAENPDPQFAADALQQLGDDQNALRAFLDQHWPGKTARGIIEMLLMPGLAPAQESALYEILATLDGSDVASMKPSRAGGEDTLVTIIRDSDQMSFTIVPEKGQLTQVRGLVGPDVTTTVDAAGVLDCVNVAGVAGPKSISLACADNNYGVEDIQWKNWSAPQAEGTGTAWINSCDPDCANGEFRQFPVKVTAREKKRCGYNLDVYTKLDLDYGEAGAGADGSAPKNETIDMPCL